MQIQEIEYNNTLELRQKYLRPNLNKEECVYPGDIDETTYHLGCYIEESLVGIVSIYKRSNTNISKDTAYQIRALTTEEAFRGKGVASTLLSSAEKKAFVEGAQYVWANARISVKDFYRKSGYRVSDDVFNVEGVGLHVIVCKTKSNY